MITALDGTAARRLVLAAAPGQDPRLVPYAFDHGINFFFTFGPGHEPFIDALRQLARTKRDRVIIATGSGCLRCPLNLTTR
jgi:hypothetical protein